MLKGKWKVVTKNSPCRNCGKFDWCSRAADNSVEICRRQGGYGFFERKDKHGAQFWIRFLGGKK